MVSWQLYGLIFLKFCKLPINTHTYVNINVVNFTIT